ncbi:ExbD/TolR family protein [Halonatronum saccharophilum]|uniref:ExbD/TolR family protein n=1 Tax=Halonatronum saccharophilum TaxID=150060 RepID=UPI000480BAEA|nr:biopolymer transporter ExbD [Halonatronum saccharophilum]
MFKSNLKRTPNIQILPMIDVIFFLLVFFMLFTTFKVSPTGLEINLPTARTVTEQEEDLQVNITIDSNGEVYLDDEKVEMRYLEFEISKYINDSPDALFIIKGDNDVKYESIVKVMDIVRDMGGYRLALAADKESLN